MAFFTAQSEQDSYENELVYSKLSNSVRVARIDVDGRAVPVVIANGCPIDFRTFNMMVAYYASGYTHSTFTEDEIDSLAQFWKEIKYKPESLNGRRGYGSYFHAQDQLFLAFGIELPDRGGWHFNSYDESPNILPALKEVGALLKELF